MYRTQLRRFHKFAWILCLVFVGLAVPTFSENGPSWLQYSGKLVISAGAGRYDITFTVYDSAAEGRVLWTSVMKAVAVDAAGNFTVFVKIDQPPHSGITDESPQTLYLGVKQRGLAEQTPRMVIPPGTFLNPETSSAPRGRGPALPGLSCPKASPVGAIGSNAEYTACAD